MPSRKFKKSEFEKMGVNVLGKPTSIKMRYYITYTFLCGHNLRCSPHSPGTIRKNT